MRVMPRPVGSRRVASRPVIGVGLAIAVSLTVAPAMDVSPAAAVGDADMCASQMSHQPPLDVERLVGTSGTFSSFAYSEGLARTVSLQQAVGDTWTTVSSATVPPSIDAAWTVTDLPYPAQVQGAYLFRFELAAAGDCVAVATEAFTVTFRKARYTFTQAYQSYTDNASPTLSTGSPFPLVGFARAEVLGNAAQVSTIVVQRSTGGGPWKTLDGTEVTVEPRANDPGISDLRAEIPPLSTNQYAKGARVAYRFASTETATVEPTASDPASIRYFNARAELKKASRRFCPGSRIVFRNAFSKTESDAAGYVIWGEKTIYYRLPVFNDLMTLQEVRHLAYHECGHRLQYTTYKSRNAANKAAKKIFGTNHSNPLEHWADCVAQSREPVANLGYGGTCTAKQLKYAVKTLKRKKLY
jgi:hypothetical protein